MPITRNIAAQTVILINRLPGRRCRAKPTITPLPHCLLPPNDNLLPPNDDLLPPNDGLLPPNDIKTKGEASNIATHRHIFYLFYEK